jgi:kumamolisin
MRTPSGYRPLPGSERPQDPGSTLIGPVERAERVVVTVLLRVRPDAPAEHDFEHWQDTPPGKRRFLSAEEYMQTHGSTEEDVKAVVDFLESKDLRVLDSSAGRRRIVAEGDAAQINAAFAVTLNRYRAPHSLAMRAYLTRGRGAESQTHEEEIYRGFEGPVHLPAELIELVRAVIGLNNRQLGHPMGTGTGDPPGANYLSPAAVAQLYNFPNTGAAGQTIGIFENAAAGAAYLQSDITAFISTLPAGYNTPPATFSDIGLTVGPTTYFNNTALVTSSPTGAVLECVVDVAISAAVSQGANLNVYFTDTSEAGWEAFFTRAITPLPGDNPPSVLTASWGYRLDDHVATVGNPTTPASPSNIMTGYLQSAALRGITVFMAIGDWGSADTIVDGSCHVAYPNGDPRVTACGGTIVGNITPTAFEEFVWSEANTASPFQNFPYVSTGGGVSDNPGFPVPPYQTAAGVLPISKNDGNSRRGVPDVAGMVAMDGFFFAGVGGPGQNGAFGTSLVAPLYAGLIAVINAFLARNTGFLNPTLYTYGPEICNDVRFCDNDAGNGPVPPDAPFYVAGPGWDPCTGWGSINGFRLRAALAPAPIIVTAIASAGDFGNVCLNSFADEILTINNTGFSLLLISNITSSSPDSSSPPSPRIRSLSDLADPWISSSGSNPRSWVPATPR